MCVFLILISLVVYYDVCRYRRGRKLSIYLVSFVLIALAGLRYRVGLDTMQYMRFYGNIPRFSDISVASFVLSRHEPLYFLVEVLAKTISPHFFVLQLIQSFFVNVVMISFFNKHTRYLFTSILLYYLILYISFNTEAMRSSMAIAVFVLSYDLFKAKRWIWYYIFSLMATMFHLSALILIVLPLLPKIKLTRVSVLYFLPLVLLAVIIGNNIESILNFVAVNDTISGKAESHLSSAYSGQVLSSLGVLSSILMYVLMPFVVVRRLLKISGERVEYEYMILLVIAISVVSIRVQIVQRLLDYFIPFLIVGFAEYLGELSYKKSVSSFTRLYAIVFVLSFVSLKIYGQYFGNISGIYNYKRYIPYSSIITENKFQEREDLYSRSY